MQTVRLHVAQGGERPRTDLLFPSVCLVMANQGMRSFKTAGQISHIPCFPESKTLTLPWGSPPENSSGDLLPAAVLAVPSRAYRLHWWSCWEPVGRKIPPNQPQLCPFLLSLTRCRKPRCWQEVFALHLIKRRALMMSNRTLWANRELTHQLENIKTSHPGLETGNRSLVGGPDARELFSSLFLPTGGFFTRVLRFFILSWKTHVGVWKDGSMAQSRYCSCKRTCVWFPESMSSSSQLPAIPTPRDPTPSSNLRKHLYSCAQPLKYN